MSLRANCFLLVAALVCAATLPPLNTHATLTSAKTDVTPALPPEPLALPPAKKLNPLQKAYLDSYCILRQSNSCSDLFGGPVAIKALNGLVKLIKPTYLDKGIVIKMGGPATMVKDDRSGFSYRLFEKAEVNVLGSFYQGNNLPNRPIMPLVGRFEPNTREARVT